MAVRGRKYNASEHGRNRRYALRYGVTVEWYEAKLKEQDGRCAICGARPEKRLAIDHCHVTGKARGLLCFLCNSALGRFEDDPARLRRALAYLES
ncbi:endonuclease VII domain-containing protein [Micromonospora sp. NPDC006766]|uniref:endonuclease VII domain-containing protein n=1 Tax=Micromonospora sp. NPDC006766 TaxID=3154778 RepID=UPI0033F5A7E7